MNTDITFSELLRWRLRQAEVDAPPAPRATRLLALARPWWETYPENFETMVRRLGTLQMRYGHAMVEAALAPPARVVPALIVRPEGEHETSIRVLYFDVRKATLQLRFELERQHRSDNSGFECTFIAEEDLRPLFSVSAQRSVANEFWLDASLPEEIQVRWSRLKVTDPMPFRLILRPQAE